MISSLVTVIKLSVATVMDSLNLTHREAMYLLDHVGADKDIITLRLSTTRVGGDKTSLFPRIPRAGTWEERGTGKKGGKGNMGRKGRPTNPVINDFIQVLVISGEWETRGSAMDLQYPSSGGALF